MDPRLEDHAVGLELRLVDLVERRERVTVQGHPEEAVAIQSEIDTLQAELAATAERLTGEG